MVMSTHPLLNLDIGIRREVAQAFQNGGDHALHFRQILVVPLVSQLCGPRAKHLEGTLQVQRDYVGE